MNKITSAEKTALINKGNLQLKDEFLTYLRSVGRSEGTINGYDNDLLIVFTYVMENLNNKDFSKIRNQKIGFVFQNFNLIGRTSALKNVELPMLYAGVPAEERTKRAKELLSKVGMASRANHMPNELSGGQKQRVAIARSLVNNPSIILADEPTGALDSETSAMVMDIFNDLNKNQGKTIILITHSKEIAEQCPRIVTIKDGEIINDSKEVLS